MEVRKTRKYIHKLLVVELIIFLVLTFWYFNRINQLHIESTKEKLIDISNGIENYFLTTIAVTESTLLQKGRIIAKLHQTEPTAVYEIISDFDKTNYVKDGWNTLGWYDAKTATITVDTSSGILKSPIPLQTDNRKYLKKALSEPEKLFLGQPVVESASNELQIPFGLGIKNHSGQHIGTLIGGFNIEKFRNNLNKTFELSQAINYTIVYKDGSVIIDSDDEAFDQYSLSILTESAKSISDIFITSTNENSWTNFGADLAVIKKMGQLPFYAFVKIQEEPTSEHYLSSMLRSLYDILVILLSCVFLTLFIRTTLLKPITQLTRRAQQIASDNPNITFKTYNTHELEILSNSLKKVVEQKFALSEANQKLEFLAEKTLMASNAKSDFIRNLQHEFRTPLNHILGAAEILESINKDQANLEYLQMIKQSGKELLENINKVINLADYDSGKIKLSESTITIKNLIEQAVSQVYTRINLKHIDVVESLESNLPKILVDVDKFVKVLVCILDNSITFSKQPNPQIKIKSYLYNSRLIISISDNGLGIQEADLERITQAFEYSGNILTKFHRGIGLGLTIVKSVLELHDADLSISSQEGIGTEIVISLPKYRAIK